MFSFQRAGGLEAISTHWTSFLLLFDILKVKWILVTIVQVSLSLLLLLFKTCMHAGDPAELPQLHSPYVRLWIHIKDPHSAWQREPLTPYWMHDIRFQCIIQDSLLYIFTNLESMELPARAAIAEMFLANQTQADQIQWESVCENFSNDIQTYDFFTSFQTTYKPMTFLPVFKRHTNLWLFYQFSNDIQTYDFFTSFQTTYNLWLFYQFSNDIQTYDFFTSFQTTYKPMTFLPVFKRHTNLWLFYQFSNDIQTYDFFTSFQTTYKPILFYQFSNDILTYDFFTSFQTTYKPMTFLPVFKRHTNLWLFYQFSNDIQTYDFFTSFQTTY